MMMMNVTIGIIKKKTRTYDLLTNCQTKNEILHSNKNQIGISKYTMTNLTCREKQFNVIQEEGEEEKKRIELMSH
jgi:uncharacterized membrane protein